MFATFLCKTFASQQNRLNATALGVASNFFIRQKGRLFADNLCAVNKVRYVTVLKIFPGWLWPQGTQYFVTLYS